MSDEEIVIVTSKERSVKKRDGIRVIDFDSEEGRKLAGTVSPADLPKAFSIRKSVRACEITLSEEGGFLAKCESKDVPFEADEECPGCSEAIAVYWALNYIKPLEDAEAEKLHQQVVSEEISPDEALDSCLKIAEEHNEEVLVDTIAYLKELAHKPLSEIQKEIE